MRITGAEPVTRATPAADSSRRGFVNGPQSTLVPNDERKVTSSPNALISWEGRPSRLLEGLAPLEVREVLAAATERRFAAGAVVTRQGARADHLFLLTTGRARHFFVTVDGRKLLLMWLPPGKMFGGTALLSKPSDYIVGTETVRPSRILVWKRTTIRNLAQRYPRLTENVLSDAVDYLNILVATQVALTCNTAEQRLATLLTTLAWGFGRKVREGIELDVTNEDLANAANVTHFTASRLLSRWSRNGILTKARGKILLHSPELLLRRSA